MKDLEKASKIDNEDKIIKEEINRINEEIKRLKALEKKNNFSGIFNKPNTINSTSNEKKNCKIVSEEKEKKIEPQTTKQQDTKDTKDTKNANMNYKLSYEVDPNAKVPDEINELGKY